MAVSINFELRNRPTSNGRYPVYLRITEGRKLKRIVTTISLAHARDWNKEKQRVRQAEPNYQAWNNELDQIEEKAKQTYRDLEKEGKGTTAQLTAVIKGTGKQPLLLAYAEAVRCDLRKEGRMGSYKKYGDAVCKLTSYVHDKLKLSDVAFKDVTPAFVKGFEAYLHTLPNAKAPGCTLNPNTIAKHMKCFRAIVNQAIAVEGFLPSTSNPFASVSIREVAPVKAKLTAEEIQAINDLELEEGSVCWHARNLFMLSYYCAGIRAGDAIQLRWANVTAEGRLVYQMDKNSKKKDIMLVDQAQQILQHYWRKDCKATDFIFPFLDSKAPYVKAITWEERKMMQPALKEALFKAVNSKEVMVNTALKKIAAKAGIDKPVTFHVSRHSFARQAKIAGTDNGLLQGIMAHSSLTTTERYMKEFDTSREDNALAAIFGAQKQSKEDALLSALQQLDKEALQALLSKVNK